MANAKTQPGKTFLQEHVETISVLTEQAENGSKHYFVEGIMMQGDIKNKNDRVYPIEVLTEECARYDRDMIQTSRAVGELGHPPTPNINLERVSHLMKSLTVKPGKEIHGKAKITSTPMGNIVKGLIDENVKFGVSLRGVATTKKTNGTTYVGDDFNMAAIDIVHDPSMPAAFVNALYEETATTWIYKDGVYLPESLVEQVIATTMATVDEIFKSTKYNKEGRERKLESLFETFCDKLAKGRNVL